MAFDWLDDAGIAHLVTRVAGGLDRCDGDRPGHWHAGGGGQPVADGLVDELFDRGSRRAAHDVPFRQQVAVAGYGDQ
jgi:hypothetical protein